MLFIRRARHLEAPNSSCVRAQRSTIVEATRPSPTAAEKMNVGSLERRFAILCPRRVDDSPAGTIETTMPAHCRLTQTGSVTALSLRGEPEPSFLRGERATPPVITPANRDAPGTGRQSSPDDASSGVSRSGHGQVFRASPALTRTSSEHQAVVRSTLGVSSFVACAAPRVLEAVAEMA